MSQDENQPITSQPEGDSAPAASEPETGSAPPDDPASTIGTGTSLALGCVAATIVLIVIGLIYLGLAALL